MSETNNILYQSQVLHNWRAQRERERERIRDIYFELFRLKVLLSKHML